MPLKFAITIADVRILDLSNNLVASSSCSSNRTGVSVSSWVAHMFPSKLVSVGMLPSDRTLETGLVHMMPPALPRTFEHCPVTDDPLTDTAPEKNKLDGSTCAENNEVTRT